MRRRALLAASQTGGGGDAPEFPLYLYFDHCINVGFMISCERPADETSITLYKYLKEIAQQYGEYNYGYVVNETVLNSLGIDIYIEGGHVNMVSLSVLETDNGIYLLTDGEYDDCTLRSDGYLIYEL